MNKPKYYIIINTSDIDTIDFSEISTKPSGLRKNKSGTKCLLCYRGRRPGFLEKYKEYTHSEILKKINSNSIFNKW